MHSSLDDAGTNPLLDDRSGAWDRLIEALGPASLLVVAGSRIGSTLRGTISADDVLQDVFLRAWRDRHSIEWRGVPAFRRWIVVSIEHRIRDLADAMHAHKRGGSDARAEPLSALSSPDGPSEYAGPSPRTTPSRAAADRERADLMAAALAGLDEDVRAIVQLRLFDDLAMDEVAARLNIGVSAAQHRFRKGVLAYHQRLTAMGALSSRAHDA